MITPEYGCYNELVASKLEALQSLVKNNQADLGIVNSAFKVANYLHSAQKRKSGEPYIIHPIEVAFIVAQLGLGTSSIVAALLHDTIEDTEATIVDIERIFGNDIATLVYSVTKLDRIAFSSDAAFHAEYFRKVVLSMSKDLRVIVIKLADRLHNMRTLDACSNKKKKRISLETMEIYTPISLALGLYSIYLELSDLSLRYIHPFRYKVLNNFVENTTHNIKPGIKRFKSNILATMCASGVKVNVILEKRSITSIYKKLSKHLNINYATKYSFEATIITHNKADCYLALGVLHSLYQPLPNSFKDYIAIPKTNGYQALHSLIFTDDGDKVHIRIMTNIMADIANNGIVSHWFNYKDEYQYKVANRFTDILIKHIVNINQASKSAQDFLNNLKCDLFPSRIHVFTPKGKIIILPKFATALDFAYYIHTDIGHHSDYAFINKVKKPMSTILKSGDIVNVAVDNSINPKVQWLSIVTSIRSANCIKQYLKHEKIRLAKRGLELLNNIIILLGFDKVSIEMIEVCMHHFPSLTADELLVAIYLWDISVFCVIRKILDKTDDHVFTVTTDTFSKLDLVKLVQCPRCLSIPGLKLQFILNKSFELELHHIKCTLNKSISIDNLCFIHIINNISRLFFVKVYVTLCNVPDNVIRFTNLVVGAGVNITSLVHNDSTESKIAITITVGVHDISQLKKILFLLNEAKFVIHVST